LQYSRLSNVGEGVSAVNCEQLVKGVNGLFESTLKEQNGTIRVNELPTVHGFDPLLKQLFQNLIGNGLKYNKSAAPLVEVGCQDRGNQWEFFVRDNGIGIDKMYFDKIFVIFQRLHQRNEYSGTGIGLAICKKIVDRHRGTIWVESQENEGSTFYFTIPKQHVHSI
jgi:light-regulated signal transduction histidine kinase (bacteriophytochrome)